VLTVGAENWRRPGYATMLTLRSDGLVILVGRIGRIVRMPRWWIRRDDETGKNGKKGAKMKPASEILCFRLSWYCTTWLDHEHS